MKKYRVILSFLLVFLLSGLVYQTKADMGPKPSADVLIIGIDEPYYFDILYEVEEYRVTLLNASQIQEKIEDEYYRDDYPTILNGYRDTDGFASYTLYRNIPHYITMDDANEDLYHLGYFSPPDTFKIVIILDSGKMFVSEIVHKKAFDASFEYDLSNVSLIDDQEIYINAGSVVEINPIVFGNLILLLSVLISITLITELLILFAFGYRDKKAYIKVGIVNIVTQLILQLLIFFAFVYVAKALGAFTFLILGEIVVFTIEVFTHRFILKEKSKARATVYALVANLASFILGLISLGYLANLIA